MKPHKHAELIKAWADGAVIERMWSVNDDGQGWWLIDNEPDWNEFDEYRIKPEPKPDGDKVVYAIRTLGDFWKESDVPLDHVRHMLKLTFDGETGKLKSAEVLK